jgi:Cu(I)/Ag(I) efflux system membrane fusion protein
VERVEGKKVLLKASRRLDGLELASAELRLPGKTALALPAEALWEAGGEAWAFRRGAQGFEPLHLHLGERGEQFVEVLDGLKEGDVVAASGLFWLEAQWRLAHPQETL